MAKRIKLKNLLKENFSGAMLGGVVSRSPWQNDISLSRIVKEKFGDTTEAEDIDIKSFVKKYLIIILYQKTFLVLQI